MSWWSKHISQREDRQRLRQEALRRHDRLARHALALAGEGALELPDDFSLRFELLMLFASVELHRMRRESGEADSPAARALWEMVFEGLDHSLRQRGVVDLRMAARMRKLFRYATGRRGAYLAALEAGDEGMLREAIVRNILNNLAQADDPRVERVLAEVEAMGLEGAGEPAG